MNILPNKHRPVLSSDVFASAKLLFQGTLPYLPIWIFLRLTTSLYAAAFSQLRPITVMEKAIAVWPLPANFGFWLNRVLLAPWQRWDAGWYIRLLTIGYVAGDGSTSFHPLYTLLSQPMYRLGFEPLFSLLTTSAIASLAFFWIFYKLACLDLSPEKSRLALIFLASFPVSIILFAPYTESVFLFFSTLALYQLRQRRWLLAAISTILASLTRQQGIFLMVPMLWFAWEDSEKSIRRTTKAWKGWLVAFTAPVGLLVWTIYRIFYLHEGTFDTHNLQNFIYTALLSPSSKFVYPDQAITWPWTTFAIALPKLLHGPDIGDVMSIAMGAGFVVLLILAWKYLHPAYRLYCLTITLVSFSMSTGPVNIYLSLVRHLFLAAPVFIGLASQLNKRWQQITLVGLQLAIQLFLLFLYITNSWAP